MSSYSWVLNVQTLDLSSGFCPRSSKTDADANGSDLHRCC